MEYELINVNNNEITISDEFRKQLINFEKAKKEIEYQSKLLKEQLIEIMPQIGKERIIIDGVSITYKKASKRTTLDSKKIKDEEPELYEKYKKESDVSPSITIKVED